MTAHHRPATPADTLAKRVPVHHSGRCSVPSVRNRTRASCTALVPIAPAILSAMRHATGGTLRRVPVLPQGRRAAMQESAP